MIGQHFFFNSASTGLDRCTIIKPHENLDRIKKYSKTFSFPEGSAAPYISYTISVSTLLLSDPLFISLIQMHPSFQCYAGTFTSFTSFFLTFTFCTSFPMKIIVMPCSHSGVLRPVLIGPNWHWIFLKGFFFKGYLWFLKTFDVS